MLFFFPMNYIRYILVFPKGEKARLPYFEIFLRYDGRTSEVQGSTRRVREIREYGSLAFSPLVFPIFFYMCLYNTHINLSFPVICFNDFSLSLFIYILFSSCHALSLYCYSLVILCSFSRYWNKQLTCTKYKTYGK